MAQTYVTFDRYCRGNLKTSSLSLNVCGLMLICVDLKVDVCGLLASYVTIRS